MQKEITTDNIVKINCMSANWRGIDTSLASLDKAQRCVGTNIKEFLQSVSKLASKVPLPHQYADIQVMCRFYWSWLLFVFLHFSSFSPYSLTRATCTILWHHTVPVCEWVTLRRHPINRESPLCLFILFKCPIVVKNQNKMNKLLLLINRKIIKQLA